MLDLSPTDLSSAWGGGDEDPRFFRWLEDLPSAEVPDRYRLGPAFLPYEPFDQPLFPSPVTQEPAYEPSADLDW